MENRSNLNDLDLYQLSVPDADAIQAVIDAHDPATDEPLQLSSAAWDSFDVPMY